MPLILQPPSCCDICMEDYSYHELAHSPHAIDCGHIFCKTCIRSFTPKVCPFCRTSFVIGRRLHVDTVEGAKLVLPPIDAHATVLLERIALVSDETSTTNEVLEVITEASDWISARSDGNDPNSHKPLRLALDALCRYRSCLYFADDLATLRIVESSLRMELQKEREATLMRHNKLQTDLKVVSGQLHAERDRFITELWAEKKTSAKVQQELRDILREAAGDIQRLRTENGCLLSELQSSQTTERALTIPEATSHLKTEGPQSSCQSSLVAETPKLPGRPYSSPTSQPALHMHSCSRIVDTAHDNNKTKAGGLPVHALPVSSNTFRQVDVNSDHSKADERNGSSSLEDIIRELRDRSRAALGDESMRPPHGRSLKQCPSFDLQALSRDRSTAVQVLPSLPKRPRRLFKMASSPSFWKNGDSRPPGVDKRGVEVNVVARDQGGCTMQVRRQISWESLTGALDVTTGTKETTPSVTNYRKNLTQRWPRSWRIFHS